jgi:hypothetical protein
MFVRRAKHDAERLAGRSDVIDKPPSPDQKPLVLEAALRTPDMISGPPRAGLTRILGYCRRVEAPRVSSSFVVRWLALTSLRNDRRGR